MNLAVSGNKKTPARRVIYDLGANNGDDIPYYLKKAELVVALEANPILSKQIEARFPAEIASGHLVIESCVLTTDDKATEVPFYINKIYDVLSQFPEPDNLEDFEKVILPSKSITSLIAKHGEPYYIKIDLEHFDEDVLKALFAANITPPFISSESHSLGIFATLVSQGGYNAFKLVEGYSVDKRYKNTPITTDNGVEHYSFPLHSAGPFGDDVAEDWMTPEKFMRVLAFTGMGWRDIHATNIRTADPTKDISLFYYGRRQIMKKFAKLIPTSLRHKVMQMFLKVFPAWI